MDVDEFEASRGHLFSIAYHMLGSVTDAEDVVQEAYLRARGAATRQDIQAPRAFLTTVVTRLCLNQLQSARAQRESYIGPWLPEPLLIEEHDPLARAETHESISMAFLVLLERLTPAERGVFLLREVFDYPYPDIARIIGKDEAACRQIFHRAKTFIVAQRPRFTPSDEQHQVILQHFLRAVGDGDLAGLEQLLADDVRLWADGGGKVRGAATRELRGRRAVARFVLGSVRFVHGDYATDLAWVNAQPAVILRIDGAPLVVICFTLVAQRIAELRVIGNPDKLRHIPPA